MTARSASLFALCLALEFRANSIAEESDAVLQILRKAKYWLMRSPDLLRQLPSVLKEVFIDRQPLKYALRAAVERSIFNENLEVHALPAIFHYWSNKHLAPVKFHPFGITDPDQFFSVYCKVACDKHPGETVNILSVGSGNCDLEISVAKSLVDSGRSNFHITCLDLNKVMLERGMQQVRAEGLSDCVSTEMADLNYWRPEIEYQVIMANQCMHHMVDLEGIFQTIKDALSADGQFLISDMIGRNGHQRWPEALTVMRPFWEELPIEKRYNFLQKRTELEFINHDCSRHSFEGIRAQDILPLLVEMFHFELFIPYGNIIFPFIDRAFGHNFNPENQWDRDFIDRIHARDEEGMLSGELKPCSMLAVLTNQQQEPKLVNPVLTPEFCVRKT